MRVLLPACALAAARLAAAQPAVDPAEEARRLFESGVVAVGRGDYAAALDAFLRSWELNPRPVTLFNAAMCRRALADLPGAFETFRRYLDLPGGDSAERTAEAERVFAEMDEILAGVTVATDDPAAEILVDGRSLGSPPPAEPLRLMAGTHVFEARLDGFIPAREVIEVGPGETLDVRLVLSPQMSPAPAGGDADDGLLSQWWFWTAIGAVVVGGGVAAGVLLWPEGGGDIEVDWRIPGN